jgi:hypothetical protein
MSISRSCLYYCYALAACSLAGAEAQAGATAAELRAAYAEQVRSILSMSTRFNITDSISGGEEGATASVLPSPLTCEWMRDGRRFNYVEHSKLATNKRSFIRYDDKYYYSCSTSTSNGKTSEHIQVFDDLGSKFEMNYRPEHLIGTEVLMTGMSLEELLALPDARVIGQVKDGDNLLWRLGVDSFPARGGAYNLALTVDLDPAHDFLPRLIRLAEAVPEGGSPKLAGWKMEWSIEQFSRVKDHASGGQRWFPTRAVLRQAEGANSPTVVVDSVDINNKIDDKYFVPEVESQAQVMDNTAKGKGRIFLIGGPEAVDNLIDSLVWNASAEARSSMRSRRRFVLLALANLVAVVVGFGVWKLRRRRRRRSGMTKTEPACDITSGPRRRGPSFPEEGGIDMRAMILMGVAGLAAFALAGPAAGPADGAALAAVAAGDGDCQFGDINSNKACNTCISSGATGGECSSTDFGQKCYTFTDKYSCQNCTTNAGGLSCGGRFLKYLGTNCSGPPTDGGACKRVMDTTTTKTCAGTCP